ASSGRQALEAIAQECPDLVLLDLGMPEMDGFEVARRIRELPECSDVVLVALTGWGQESDRQRTREAGIDYHLVKPATMADLQGVLTKALPQEDTAGLA